jgi:hypothetical protein
VFGNKKAFIVFVGFWDGIFGGEFYGELYVD